MTVSLGYGLHHALLRSRSPILFRILITVVKPSNQISTSPARLVKRNSSTTAIRINHNTRVNGPVSTLPAPLVLPAREPGQSLISFAFKRGKGFLSFYKTGFKNVYHNYIASRRLRSLPPSQLSRSDFLLLRRSSQDIRRIPLFALVFLICGEFTPLVVIFMTGVVPGTCKIPNQIAKEREKIEAKRKMSFRELDIAPPPSSSSESVGGKNKSASAAGIDALSKPQLLHINRSLNLGSSFWPDPPLTSILKRRIGAYFRFLETDDGLLTRDGGVSQLEMEEVRRACEDRGIDVLGRDEGILRGTLRKWLEARKKSSIERLVLTRPSVWAMKDS